MPALATADLCDAHPVAVADPVFRDFGGAAAFAGRIVTAKVHEDNALVRELLSQPAEGCVLVIDGGGSLRTALVGDRLAALARDHGYRGLVVYGAVRDAATLTGIDLGIKALAACPRRSDKTGHGSRGVPVTFAGVTFRPGAYLYADADGIVVSDVELR